jgi:hypothetical protein
MQVSTMTEKLVANSDTTGITSVITRVSSGSSGSGGAATMQIQCHQGLKENSQCHNLYLHVVQWTVLFGALMVLCTAAAAPPPR